MKLRIAAAIVLLASPSFAAEFTCRVKEALDGDTLACFGMQEKVRLADIDAPEIEHPGKPAQPYGEDARRALKSMVGGKDIKVVWREKDRYDRYIGTVYVGDIDVNAQMVRGGHAWVYKQYAEPQREAFLLLLEEDARRVEPPRGLWALPVDQQIEPWEFRKGKKPAANDNEDQSVSPPGILPGPECGTKKTCKDMTSCAEAKEFFTLCQGMSKLDRNKDGVPCEELCAK